MKCLVLKFHNLIFKEKIIINFFMHSKNSELYEWSKHIFLRINILIYSIFRIIIYDYTGYYVVSSNFIHMVI